MDARMLVVVAARLGREEEEEEDLDMLLLTPVSELTPPQWQRLGDPSVVRASFAAEAQKKRKKKTPPRCIRRTVSAFCARRAAARGSQCTGSLPRIPATRDQSRRRRDTKSAVHDGPGPLRRPRGSAASRWYLEGLKRMILKTT